MLTYQEAEGRRELIMAGAIVWVPLVLQLGAFGFARGFNIVTVVLSLLATVLIAGLIQGWDWARWITGALLGIGAIVQFYPIAMTHSWAERAVYFLTAAIWGGAASKIEFSEAIDAYVAR
jgi:hypothetical protein